MRGWHTETGLRKDACLDNSDLPFRKVALFCYFWSKESISIKFSKHELGIKKDTVVDWNKFVREVNTADLLANPVVIGGPNTTVEVDKSLFIRRKIIKGASYYSKGNLQGNTWVFCVYCSRQLGCNPIPNKTESLWVASGGIQAMGYTDLTINHTCEFVDPIPGAYTQNVGNSRQNTKLSNKKQHRAHRIMLDSYLCESMWQ